MDCKFTTCLSRWYLKNIIHNKDVFGLYVTMKYTISMHVVHGCIPSTILQQWVDVHNIEPGNRCEEDDKRPWPDVVVRRSLIMGDHVPPYIPWGLTCQQNSLAWPLRLHTMSPNISCETVEMPTFHQLIHVAFDAVFSHVVATASNELVDVHLHQLEHQSQSSCGPVAVNFTISYVSTTYNFYVC